MTPLRSTPLHSTPKIGGVELKNRKPEWGGWKWSGVQMGWNCDFKNRRKWSGVELAVGVEPRFLLTEWGERNWSGDQSGVAAEWSANGVEQRFQNSTEVEWSGIGYRSGTAIFLHGVG